MMSTENGESVLPLHTQVKGAIHSVDRVLHPCFHVTSSILSLQICIPQLLAYQQCI